MGTGVRQDDVDGTIPNATNSVIASEAERSSLARKSKKLDCFAARAPRNDAVRVATRNFKPPMHAKFGSTEIPTISRFRRLR
jgi:hypothetical protein